MQNDLINGRTPEEIKAGLKACTTAKVPGYGCNIPCPYLNTPNCWLPVKSDALALIEHLEAKVPKWISVEERLPESPGGYGVYAFGKIMALDFDENEDWWDDEYNHYNGGVTHWMPLPEPPEKGTR